MQLAIQPVTWQQLDQNQNSIRIEVTFNVVNIVVGARQHNLIHWDFHSDKTISMVGTDDGPKKERLSTES